MVDLNLVGNVQVATFADILRLWLMYSKKHMKVKGVMPPHTFSEFVIAIT